MQKGIAGLRAARSGALEGPPHRHLPLKEIIDLALTARPQALSFEGADPRHEHE